MSNLIKNIQKCFLHWVLRAPIWLYHAGLGWILSERFLMLSYNGRKSGLPRETIIEVVRHDNENDIYYVASGWGTKSDWFQSIRTNPEVKIQVGKFKVNAHPQILDSEEAAHESSIYAKDHPSSFLEIFILLTGKVLQGT